MGRFILGYDSAGRTLYQYVYGRTYDEAAQKLKIGQEIELRWLSGKLVTVGSIYKEWLPSVAQRVKESTLANYRNKFEKHILPVFGEQICSQLTSNTLNRFIRQKLKNGLSASYVRDMIAVFRTLLRYAQHRYHFDLHLESVTLPKIEKRETSAISECEQRALTSYLESHMSLTSFGILISLMMGLRIGELCGLRWEDVDLQSKCIHVRRTVQRISSPENGRKTKIVVTSPKSRTSRRTIPIPAKLMRYFRQFQADGNCWLLTGTTHLIEPRTMQYRYKKLLRDANLGRHHYHKLRHTFATNCMEHGFDIKTLSVVLGHSNVSMTMSRYLHPDLKYERRLMNRVCAAMSCQ